MRLLILFFAAVVFLGCQDVPPVPKPDPFISKEKMIDIQYDIAIINAARGYGIQKLKRNGVDPDRYIFEKYDIDSVQYAENTAYHSQDIDNYKEIFAAVKVRIDTAYSIASTTENELQRRKDSIRTAEVKERRRKDSIAKANGVSVKDSIAKRKKGLMEIQRSFN